MAMEWLSSLNDEQRKAVETTEGYVRLVAGAGTGKTRSLTYRYVFLLQALGISPKKVLCITFTNKAANEMKKRVTSLCGLSIAPLINTFHGFCASFLKEHIVYLGYPSQFSILDTQDQKQILSNIYKENNIKAKEYPHTKLIAYIGSKKSTLDYIDIVLHQDTDYIKQMVENSISVEDKIFYLYIYQQRMTFSLDFDDLINFTLYILERNKSIQDTTAKNLEYILVDEFQDIDEKQYKLIVKLSAYNNNLFIVGDPDQTIYSFRGARVSFFMDFDKHFNNVTTLHLTKNYRSQSKILKCAYEIISKNPSKVRKKLVAMRDDVSLKDVVSIGTIDNFTQDNNIYEDVKALDHYSNKTHLNECRAIYKEEKKEIDKADKLTLKPIVVNCKSKKSQNDYIITKIKEIKESYPYRTIAILSRSRYQFSELEISLVNNKIPYKMNADVGLFERRVIKDVIAYLRLITNTNDNNAFDRIINVPSRGLGPKRISYIKSVAEKLHLSYFDALSMIVDGNYEDFENGACKYIRSKDEIKEFVKKIESNIALAQKAPLDGLNTILNDFNYEDNIRNNGNEEELNSIAVFKRLCTDYNNSEMGANLADFLISVSLQNKGYELDSTTQNQVILSTVHNVKGLEYDYVFLPDLNKDIFPSAKAQTTENLEEERRLFYVAITRACVQLFMLQCGDSIYVQKEKKMKERSYFLDDFAESSIYEIGQRQESEIVENPYNETIKTLFEVGDKVHHYILGDGIIKEVDLLNGEYLVLFTSINKERTLQFKAPLEKI